MSSHLRSEHLPGLFHAADSLALASQRASVQQTAGYLLLVVAAAVGGAVSIPIRDDSLEFGGVLSVVAFVGALILGLVTVSRGPERHWYRARAIAESVKSLAWRYAVSGQPFPATAGDPESELSARLRRVLDEMRDLPLPPVPQTSQVTAQMRALRGSSLEDRRQAYLRDRIHGQHSWYTAKATINRRRGHQWAVAVGAASTFGVLAGCLRALTIIEPDALGVMAAIAAALSSWMQFRQHSTLSAAYALAAQDLTLARDAAHAVRDESAWASYVADAESAISREHTMWLAQKSRS